MLQGKRSRDGCQSKHNKSQPLKFSPTLKANLNSVSSAFALISLYSPFATIRNTISNTLLQVGFSTVGSPLSSKISPLHPSELGITFLTRVWL